MSALDAHRWKIVKAAIEDGRVAFVREAIVPLQPFSSNGYYELTPRMRDGRTGFAAEDFLVSEAEGFGIEYCVHRWLILAALLWLREREVAADAELCFIRPASQSLMDEQFGAFVIQMLHESKVHPGRLCFEIAEEDVLKDTDTLVERFLLPIRDLGCRIAIDDFGTGKSSLNYLHYVPVHFIKIDDRFVARILHDEVDQTTVTAYSRFGRALRLAVIAKGADSPEVITRLREMEVGYAQGLAT